MSSSPDFSVVLTNLSFTWPNGDPVLSAISGAFGLGRTGLIGANGSGKTTLLHLIRGALTPTSGSIATTGPVGYLPQQPALRASATVADLLGVRGVVDALRAIESGDTSARHFEAVGDDWDVEARAVALLDSVGLGGIGLDRVVGRMSGGETVLAALAGLRMANTPIVLLDEPTNNLDRDSRHRLYDVITAWRRTLIVVSHDTQLLDLMDDTADLRAGSLTVFGGPYSAYRDHLAREQAAAEQALRTAEQTLKVERRQRIEAETKLARRRSYARTDYENKRRPKAIMKQRATEAQVSAGKLRGEVAEKVEIAEQEVQRRTERVRRVARIRIDLADPGVGSTRRLAEFRSGTRSVVLCGSERMALTGPNGVGKTRLLETLIYPERAEGRTVFAVRHTDRLGYLPQRLDHLDDRMSVLDVVRAAAPAASPREVRARLARFLFDADSLTRPVGTLSGGERFRVALARLLLADPPNQLLVLDEPTNNLDLQSVDALVDALRSYRGGMIVVSHDDDFLARLGTTVHVTLTTDGTLDRS